MATLQGPVVCPTVRAKQVGVYVVPINGPLARTSMLRSCFWGYKNGFRRSTNTGVCTRPRHIRRVGTIQCTISSSSNGNGSKAENFSEKDEDYVNSSVIEAALRAAASVVRYEDDRKLFRNAAQRKRRKEIGD